MNWRSKTGKIILAGGTFILMVLMLSPFIASVYFSVTEVKVADQVSSANQVNIDWDATVRVTHKDQEGNVLYYYEGSNLLTNAGADAIKELLGNGVGTTSAYDYIAVGNGTAPTTSSTSLDNEIAEGGLSRASGTYTDLAVGRWKIENVYSIVSSVGSINSTGLFNASSSGLMIAGDTFTAVNGENGDSLNVSWDITQS